MHKRKRKSGEAAAALGGLWLGLAGVVGSHLWSTADPAGSKPVLLKLGNWMPGWWGIGPFSGKETVGLVMWLGGWLVLHFLLRRLEVPVRKTFSLFLIAFSLAARVSCDFGLAPGLAGMRGEHGKHELLETVPALDREPGGHDRDGQLVILEPNPDGRLRNDHRTGRRLLSFRICDDTEPIEKQYEWLAEHRGKAIFAMPDRLYTPEADKPLPYVYPIYDGTKSRSYSIVCTRISRKRPFRDWDEPSIR